MKKKTMVSVMTAMALAVGATAMVATAAESTGVEFAVVDTTIYDSATVGYSNSCYDVNKDGVADAADLVLMKRWLLGDASVTPEYALRNAEYYREYIAATEAWLKNRNAGWFGRVANIHMDAIQMENGIINGNTVIVTVTFDTALDEDAIRSLVYGTGFNGEEAFNAFVTEMMAANANSVRVVFDGSDIAAVVPVSNGTLTTSYEVRETSEIEIISRDYIAENSAYWYARLNAVAVEEMTEGSFATVTLTFDRTLDEEAVHTILTNLSSEEECEAEYAYIVENNINKVKLTFDDGNVTAAVAVK